MMARVELLESLKAPLFQKLKKSLNMFPRFSFELLALSSNGPGISESLKLSKNSNAKR